MVAPDPSQRIGELKPAFMNRVQCAKVMPEREVVGNVEVRLASCAGEIVMSPGILEQCRVDQAGFQRRVDGADDSLIADEQVSPAAWRTNAPAVFGVAHQLIWIARILDIVPQRNVVPGCSLVIESDETIIVMLGSQNAEILGGYAEVRLCLIDGGKIVQEIGGQDRSFLAPLAFVVGEDEGPVPLDRSANGAAELILLQAISLRRGLQ